MSFGTIWTIIGVLTNFWTLALIALVLGGAAVIYFIPPPLGGPAKLIKLAMNPMVWAAIVVALAVIYMGSSTKKIEEQKQEIHQNEVQKTTVDDSIAVVTDLGKVKEDTHQKAGKVRRAIQSAPQGDQVDAALDEIARQQCGVAVSSNRPDCLHK